MDVTREGLIFSLILEEEPEGSGDVCQVDGSTCPDEKCCRSETCLKEAPSLQCCDDPSSENSCSPCPTCGN